MNLNGLKKYLGIFILAVAIIAVYKTFDNFSIILDWFGTLGKLLTPFFISFAIAYLLYPLCLAAERRFEKSKLAFFSKNRRGLAVAAVYVSLLILVALVISFIVPIAAKNISDFVNYFPSLVQNITAFLEDFDFYGLNFSKLTDKFSLEKLISGFELSSINKYAAGVMGISSAILNIAMAFIISVYILLDRHNLKAGAIRVGRLFIRPRAEMLIKKYVKSINTFVYKYISCQLTDAFIVFVLSLIVLSVMRVRYSPIFAALLGICNLIPYFGAIIASVVIIVVTLFTSTIGKAVAVGIAILVMQQLDANVINPALVKDQLSVKPFWVILGILIGGGFFGVLGIFFAAPVMALLKIMFNDYITVKELEKAEKEKEL